MDMKNNTSFRGDILQLVSGSGLAQLITLATAPIITRYYGPEVFGTAATMTAIIGIIVSLACFRYEQTIMLPKSDRNAANIFIACMIFTLFTSALCGIFITTNYAFQWIPKDSVIHPYRWLIPIAILIGGISISIRFWSARTKYFSRISVAAVLESAVSASTKIYAGSFGYISGGTLIISNIAAQFISLAILAKLIIRKDGLFIYKSTSRLRMWRLVKKYKDFPIYGTWSILLGNGSWLIPTVLFGIYFSPEFAGLYAMSVAVLQIPTSLFGSAVSQVYLQKASEAYNNNTLEATTQKLFNPLVAFSVFPYLLLSVIGPDLFEFVFGIKWREAGVYVQYLAPWALLWFISSPFTGLFSVLKKQKLQLLLNILNFSSRILSIIIAIYFSSPFLAILLLGLGGLGIYGCKIIVTYKIAQIPLGNAITPIIEQLFISLPIITLILIAKKFEMSALLVIGVSFALICIHLTIFNIKYNPQEKFSK
jgi:lipopolysaccharide exporter